MSHPLGSIRRFRPRVLFGEVSPNLQEAAPIFGLRECPNFSPETTGTQVPPNIHRIIESARFADFKRHIQRHSGAIGPLYSHDRAGCHFTYLPKQVRRRGLPSPASPTMVKRRFTPAGQNARFSQQRRNARGRDKSTARHQTHKDVSLCSIFSP